MSMKVLSLLLFLVLLSASSFGPACPQQASKGNEVSDHTTASDDGPVSSDDAVAGGYTENLGQWNEDLLFIMDMPGGHIGLGRGSFFIHQVDRQTEPLEHRGPVLNGPVQEPQMQEAVVIGYELLGCNDVAPVGYERLEGDQNFFKGNDPSRWVRGARSYAKVSYHDIWDGIDLDLIISGAGPKYEFTVSPGVDPTRIRIRISGHEGLSDSDGGLRIDHALGSLTESGLVVFEGAARGRMVTSSFELLSDDTFGFDIGEYDEDLPLVIDPLICATYFGGRSNEELVNMEVDDLGNVILCGNTYSKDFPTTPGAYSREKNGEQDVFVSMLNHNCSSLIRSTFFGGWSDDSAVGMSTGPDGDVYITGVVRSTDFPTTNGAYQTEHNGGLNDGYVVRMKSDLSNLSYSTYVGGPDIEQGSCIAVDEMGYAYVGGISEGRFPTTNGCLDDSFNGRYDAVVFKVNTDGSGLVFSTYLGGDDSESAWAIDLDNNGNILVSGGTSSSDFPITANAFDRNLAGRNDLFMTKLNNGGNTNLFSTYIGGSESEYVRDIFVDDNGDIYVTGSTSSLDFPCSQGAYDNSFGGRDDGFCLKLNTSGSLIHYSTYIGGSSYEYGGSIDVDEQGNAFICGWTESSNFPVTPYSYDTTINGALDGFASAISPDGKQLVYSTFIGANSSDYGFCIDINTSDVLTVAMFTYSTTLTTTPNAYSGTNGGSPEIYLIKFDVKFPPAPPRGLRCEQERGTNHLAWNVPENDGGEPLLGYRIYRAEGAGSFSRAGETTDTTYDDETIDDGKYYTYHVRAFNSVGESIPSNEITARDLIAPSIVQDLTPSSGTTGDPFVFSVIAHDNIGIGAVYVNHRFSRSPTFTNASMDDDGSGKWAHGIQIPSDSLDPLEYYFVVMDLIGNVFSSDQGTVIIQDDDPPVFLDDLTSPSGTSGKPHMFAVIAEDNVDLQSVMLEYWYEGGEHSNQTMLGEGSKWSFEIVLDQITGRLFYRFRGLDLGGGERMTDIRVVDISDDMLPEFSVDRSDREATTGDPFHFEIEVSDNVLVKNLTLEYWLSTDGERNRITKEQTSISHDMDMPFQSLPVLNYRFMSWDASGNMNSTDVVQITVSDDDPPDLTDMSDSEASTGVDFLIDFTASDNIRVDKVEVHYWFGHGDHWVLETEADGNRRSGAVDIPEDEGESFNYQIKVIDASGNSNIIVEEDIEIIDVIPPEIGRIANMTVEPGKETSIVISATDNIGVAGYKWTGGELSGSGMTITFMFGEPGEYRFVIEVWDRADNTATSEFWVNVTDDDGPGRPDGKTDRRSNPDDPFPIWVVLIIVVVVMLILVNLLIIVMPRLRREAPELDAPARPMAAAGPVPEQAPSYPRPQQPNSEGSTPPIDPGSRL
ncbi:MAG: SBBP repeat-containing protein [Thermoplasmatota archaeon]